ncbi:uncharacterized protein KD926_002242 [Aspergillus affinis]|uniref:uncharacterized protein n=1 Tax=Aspergillus affinis TaxID=1070780 RepID=UPI0022FEF00F|nr:uncharacterized protein KD926_002242 [Aspergillus affinis]KAI9036154.1 hypothetical protein KD926_002242 [Aspergillus affinis]
MFLDQILNAFCGMLLHYLNIVLYASSDNYMFIEAERLLHEFTRRDASIVSLFIMPVFAEVLKAFIHYFLGHILTLVMILEAETLHTHSSTLMQVSTGSPSIPAPVSRSILSACIFLVRTAGLRVFFKGIRAAIVYRASFLLTTLFIEKIERLMICPRSFAPFVARVLSTVFLSNLHLAWTQATICIPSSALVLSAPRSASFDQPPSWRILALPSLFFAIVQILMDLLPRILLRVLITLIPEPERTASPWKAKLASQILITVCRLALHFPALTALTLIEVRLLPDLENTIVPSIRGRGARMSELGALGVTSPYARPGSGFFWDVGASFGAGDGPGLHTRLGLDLVRWTTVLWLCKLHVKNCLLQFAVEVLLGR